MRQPESDTAALFDNDLALLRAIFGEKSGIHKQDDARGAHRVDAALDAQDVCVLGGESSHRGVCGGLGFGEASAAAIEKDGAKPSCAFQCGLSGLATRRTSSSNIASAATVGSAASGNQRHTLRL